MVLGSHPDPPRKKCCMLLNKIMMATGFESSSSETGKGKSKTRSKISHGYSLVKGKASHPMEDFHVAEFRRFPDHELGLFAIYDGHLSHEVPRYLQAHLFDNILKQPNFWIYPLEAMMNAYKHTDKFILQNEAQLGVGGSTAVNAILIDGRSLLVANVGDSRAVLCRSGDAIQLTVEHEPNSERKEIMAKGGFVCTLPGDVPRVDGQLAVARAFGDKNLKFHLSAEPDVVHFPVTETDEFLILASDGLWKVMENQEAVDLIKKIKDPKVAAKLLSDEALTRKSKDDISCIVVRLK